jgi:catechol 2,3-dioxygenase-like lactoylglutathione lyase family enzyme
LLGGFGVQEAPMIVSSQITFLYFKDLAEPSRFFEEILKFKKVEDQGFARIYQTSAKAFLGIVDEKHGYCRAPTEKSVLITLVVDDVRAWYDYLKSSGVRIEREPAFQAKANVECFFFQGPGGYVFEVQRFLSPEVSVTFE